MNEEISATEIAAAGSTSGESLIEQPENTTIEVGESDDDHVAEKILTDLPQVYGEQRVASTSASIAGLVQTGARPYRVFSEIAGQWSRADNIFCGIVKHPFYDDRCLRVVEHKRREQL